MHKKICILLIVFIFLCSCNTNNSKTLSNNEEPNYKESNYEESNYEETNYEKATYYLDDISVIYKQDKNYQILSNEEVTVFYYSIKDDNGYIIDAGYHNQRGSFDIYQNGDLLTLNYGHGGNSWHERYYDLSSGRVSRFFEGPIKNYNELVAYFTIKGADNSIVLVVQNIFDPSDYYKEIIRDFSDFVIKDEVEAEFLENGTKLKISYWIKPDNQKITEIIDLYD